MARARWAEIPLCGGRSRRVSNKAFALAARVSWPTLGGSRGATSATAAATMSLTLRALRPAGSRAAAGPMRIAQASAFLLASAGTGSDGARMADRPRTCATR